MNQSNDTTIITSYLPTYRTPPEPVKCIDWFACDLANFGEGSNNKNLVVDNRVTYGDSSPYVHGHMLEALAKRYIMAHPEMIEITPEQLKKGFALSQLYKLAQTARNFGNSNMAIISGTIDALNPPDEMLSFEHIICSLTVNVQQLLKEVKRQPSSFVVHLAKRVKDKRYGFLKPRKMHKPGYWMNSENWTGFAGGFILDFYLYKCLPLAYRQSMWTLPQRCYSNEKGSITKYMAINRKLAEVFQDPVLVKEIAEFYRSHMGDFYSTYAILTTDLLPVMDHLITEMIQDPNQYKQRLIERNEREKQSTTRQQGQILQGQGVTIVAGAGIAYPRVDDIVTAAPGPSATRQVPVHGADGSIIGTTRAPVSPVNEARAELERLLTELRQREQP